MGIISAWLLVLSSAASPTAPGPATLDTLLTQGDLAFKERRHERQARESLDKFRRAHATHPKSAEAAWKRGMAAYFVGMRLTAESAEREALYQEGRDAAESGCAIDPKCAPCHFWAAINGALYGDSVGPFKMLFSLEGIRAHARKVIELEPGYAYGGAHRLLGLIEQKLPGLLGGSNDRAKAHFQEAIRVAPDEPLNYLFLSKLLRDLGEDGRSRSVALLASALPTPALERLESLEALDEVRLLAQSPKTLFSDSSHPMLRER